jgi:alpha/beta superfamily hydrolase
MKEERAVFESHGQKVSGVLHVPDGEIPPVVVMCHGFTGDRDENGLFVHATRSFCEGGFAVLRFDFRGSGESEGEFEDVTISGDVADFKSALDFVLEKSVGRGRLGVLGLSLGSVVSVLGWDERVKAMVLWSPASNFGETCARRLGREMVKQIERRGFYDLQKPPSSGAIRTRFRVSRRFCQEAMKIRLVDDIKSVKCPVLIVQGTRDDVINPHDSQELYNMANQPKMIRLIKGADHTYHHPKHEEEAVQASIEWFKKWLKRRMDETQSMLRQPR